MSTIKVDTIQTTGGVGLYPARAWVLFNGEGSTTIRGSGNVSSLTDNGTGTFTTNFASALSSQNYGYSHGISGNADLPDFTSHYKQDETKTTGAFKVRWGYASPGAHALSDPLYGGITVLL
tara:strand:+ start:994 stop:1356 length:363 start_codon:yes stop_codon:yes gene_type:complete